jgi:hypothetical protein
MPVLYLLRSTTYNILTPIIKRLTQNITTKIYPQLHVPAVLGHHHAVYKDINRACTAVSGILLKMFLRLHFYVLFVFGFTQPEEGLT